MDNTQEQDWEQVDRAFVDRYPRREKYHFAKLIRAFFESGAYAKLVSQGADGAKAAGLILYVASQEDRYGYQYPPKYWVSNLQKMLHMPSPKQPPEAIRLAKESGWLLTTWTGQKTRREFYFYTQISSEVGTCSQEASSEIGTYADSISSEVGTCSSVISSDPATICSDPATICSEIGIPPSLDLPSLDIPSLKESALSEEFTLANQSQPRKPKRKTQDTDPELLAWVDLWNRLHADKVVGVSVSRNLSEHLRKAWDRVKETKELQELLKDPEKIEAMIRESNDFLQGGWFDLAKLLSGKNSERAYIVRKLLDGAYRNRSNRPGANVGPGVVNYPTVDYPKYAESEE